ncbi:hypothetical protein [Thermoanaerobacterium sp. RBIITD]|uniref:hypothetical protein n=1 Tax=Thermoanaerobacterium sp. RBIITD TaxID=1550240 RepID=UPI000BB8504B|nr:hypothetical protein [Thermoanaerobacterium sp. RBIITD]
MVIKAVLGINLYFLSKTINGLMIDNCDTNPNDARIYLLYSKINDGIGNKEMAESSLRHMKYLRTELGSL